LCCPETPRADPRRPYTITQGTQTSPCAPATTVGTQFPDTPPRRLQSIVVVPIAPSPRSPRPRTFSTGHCPYSAQRIEMYYQNDRLMSRLFLTSRQRFGFALNLQELERKVNSLDARARLIYKIFNSFLISYW
jgi:hypothetical protein